MTLPDSVVITDMRRRVIGWYPSSPSTRLDIAWPSKVTAGSDALPPTLPVRVMEESHSDGVVVSPVAGKVWASVQASMSWYAVPTRAWVRMPVSRFVVQKEGPWLAHEPVDAQFWSSGTSGQCALFAVVRLDVAQSNSVVARQRSEVSKKTCPAAGAAASYTLSLRCPYWIFDRTPARV